MKRIWKQSLYRVTVWLAAEIILNCLGIDNLADYSEFVFEHNTIDFDSSYPFSKTSAQNLKLSSSQIRTKVLYIVFLS